MKHLVKLNDQTIINPDEVAELSVIEGGFAICVRMKSGTVHRIEADYGKGAFATMDRLQGLIDGACGGKEPGLTLRDVRQTIAGMLHKEQRTRAPVTRR